MRQSLGGRWWRLCFHLQTFCHISLVRMFAVCHLSSYSEEPPSTVCRRFCYVLNLTFDGFIRQHDLLQPIKGQSCPQLNCCVNSQSCVNQLIHCRVSPAMFNSSMTLLWCRPHHSQTFRPRPYASASVVVCSLLLLLAAGDVEPNPGPHQSLHIGSYNIRSVHNKTGSLHDILFDFNIDILALCETRVKPARHQTRARPGWIQGATRPQKRVQQSTSWRRTRCGLPWFADD